MCINTDVAYYQSFISMGGGGGGGEGRGGGGEGSANVR